MLVQILASSACTGVVCTIGAPSGSNSRAARSPERLADAADDARQRADLLHEAVGGDPLGHVRDEDVLADPEAALLLQVAGDELGRARRDRRAQHEQVVLAQVRQQVVEHGADVADVDLDVRQRGRAEREHDRVGLRGVGGAAGEVEVDARDQLVGAGLLERHPPLADRGQALGVACRRRARRGPSRRS